jgi:hypothetical protein
MFVANCRNLTAVCDESDKLVSTPGAPNIRIVPSVVPVELDIYEAKRSSDDHPPTANRLDTGSNAKVAGFNSWSKVMSVPTSQSCLSRKSVEKSVRERPMLLNMVWYDLSL